MIRKTIILALFFVFTSSFAQAADFGEIRYPDRPLNLRKARSPRSRWVGLLHPGQKVRVAYLKNGWVAVFEPYMKDKDSVRIAGYANLKYLKRRRGDVEPADWGEIMHAGTVLNIRDERTARSPKVGALLPDETVRIDFPEDDWVAVFSMRDTIRSQMNAIGYVNKTYLNEGPGTGNKLSAKTAPVSGDGGVRSSVSPAPVQSEMAAADDGGSVETVEKDTGQARLESKIEAEIEAKPEWGEIVTLAHRVDVRKAPSRSAKFVRSFDSGRKIKVDFYKDGWFSVFAVDAKVRGEHRAMGYVSKSQMETGEYQKPRPVAKTTETGRKEIVIKRDPLAPSSRPVPKGDKIKHGISYKVLEKSETSSFGQDVIIMKVFVDVKRLPKASTLEDFVSTLWKENRVSGKLLEFKVYLPQMDLDDIAFVVARYTYNEQLEFWARRTALYGTRFMSQ